MATKHYPPLTSNNIQKLQKHLEQEDRKHRSLKSVPVRTEADGKSSVDRLSRGSELDELKKNLNENSSKLQKHRPGNGDAQQIVRPEREAVRNNPEGRSNGPSRAAPTPVKKLKYEDDTDQRINYEDTPTDEEDSGNDEQEDRLSNKEEADDATSEVSSSVSSTPEPSKTTRSRTTRTSDNSDVTSQGGQTSDEEDDLSDDSTISPSNTSVSPTQSVYTTGYATSVAESISTIPTNPPSRAETVASKSSIKTEKRPESSKSNVSDTPSYILNRNQYRMKQILVKTSKAQKSEESESDSSFNVSRENSFSDVYMRDRPTSSAQSRGSYVTVRHFSRWSNQSDGGYSIQDEPIPSRFKRRSVNTVSVNTVSSLNRDKRRDIAVGSASNQLRTARVQSEPNMRPKGRRRTTIFIDTNILHEGRSNAPSRLSGRRTGTISRMSTRSIMKQPAAARAKSEPSLRAQLRRLSFRENHPLNTGKRQKSSSRRSSRGQNKKSKGNVNNGDDSANEFLNRTKRVRKRKERPERNRVDSGVSGVSSVIEEDLPVSGDKPLRRRRRRARAVPQNTNMIPEELKVSENKSRKKRKGKTTSNNANETRESPQTTKEVSGNKDTKARTKKSSSSSEESSEDSSEDSSDGDTLSGEAKEEKNRVTSASTIVSRKTPLIKFINDSGFFAARQYQSSPTSYRAPMTPDSFRYHRSPSVRSELTIYSSDPSRPVTRRSFRSRPSTSLSFLSRATPTPGMSHPSSRTNSAVSARPSTRVPSPGWSRLSSRIPSPGGSRLSSRIPYLEDYGAGSSRSSSFVSSGESTAIGPDGELLSASPGDGSSDQSPEREKENKHIPEKQIQAQADSGGSDSTDKQLRLPPIKSASSTKSPYNTHVTGKAPTMKELVEKFEKLKKKRTKKSRRKAPKLRINHPMPSFAEATREKGLIRMITLSRPKRSKAVYATSFEPNWVWGNQETIWPLSRAALSATATPRVEELATPKKNFRLDHPEKCSRGEFTFSCGRNSVIWQVSPLAMKAEPSARISELAKHKQTVKEFDETCERPSYIFGCGRSSPIWPVGQAAKTAEEREHTLRLAEPKRPHPAYHPGKPVIWPVSEAAKKAVLTPRVEQLARPKTRGDGPFREPTWRVSSASRRTVATPRVLELARPKQLAEGYQPCREVEWIIPRNTLRAIASERTQVLSKPIIRETMDHVQFNPDAFTVSEAAKNAKISGRIAELAQPLTRSGCK